jgi:hypothetical protein
MIHVTPVTTNSRQRALAGFDSVVKKIEVCRANEANGTNLFAAWAGNPNDKATCDACDARTFCPALKEKNPNRPSAPSLPN